MDRGQEDGGWRDIKGRNGKVESEALTGQARSHPAPARARSLSLRGLLCLSAQGHHY